MNSGKAVDLNSFVAQRGGKDCVVAALATVIGRPYDEVANALGISINAQTKQREVDRVDLLDTIYPLLRLGWLAAPLVAKEHSDVQGSARQTHLPTGDEIKAALSGVPAVIGYTDPDDQVGEHALAWDGQRAIDCSNGEEVSLDYLTIDGALMLVSLPSRPSA